MGSADGVLRTRTVRRRPEEQRWTSDCLDMVGGLPLKPNPSDDLGGEVMPAIDMPMAEPEVEIMRPEYCEGDRAEASTPKDPRLQGARSDKGLQRVYRDGQRGQGGPSHGGVSEEDDGGDSGDRRGS